MFLSGFAPSVLAVQSSTTALEQLLAGSGFDVSELTLSSKNAENAQLSVNFGEMIGYI